MKSFNYLLHGTWTVALVPTLLLAVSCGVNSAPQVIPANGNNLPNLAEAPTKPRFKITDRVWPSKAGEADICLWPDDKLAAMSFTIDDNTAPDVDWWLEKSKEYEIPLTWFIITGRVNSANAYWGTWDLWKKLQGMGHAVESHTVTHLHTDEAGWKSIEWEYEDSQKQIEANITGHKNRFIAYPGGANSKLNDFGIAAKYYLAGRGTRGAINPANQIDYLNTNGMTGISIGNEKAPFADPNSMLNPKARYYRGWSVHIFHKVNNPESVQPLFDFRRTNAKELWVGLFGDVAMYGQERDTAKLKVDENTPELIAFTLTDNMDNTRFTYPLTVKVRLPDNWKTAVATQKGKAANARIVEHEGAKYALVQAIPDQGQVVLRAQ